MSQTAKTLKKIACGEEYKTLEAALEQADYANIAAAYLKITELLKQAEKEVVEKIQSLLRRNKDEDREKFRAAFELRTETTLPKWHWLKSELKKQRVMEGEVFGFGSKGDPLVKTPEGRVVVIRSAQLKEADKVKFKIVAEGEKIDFGRLFEFTPDSLYYIISQSTRDKIRDSLTAIEERINSSNADEPSELSGLLKELEDLRELIPKLRPEEGEKVATRILAFRKRLLKTYCLKLAFDHLSQEEEREIKESCRGDGEQLTRALSAPGLFRQQSHEALKAELLSEGKLKGYTETLNKLRNNLDSMDAALKLMEFESGTKEQYLAARRYLEGTDKFFEGLHEKARRVAFSIAGAKTHSLEEIGTATKSAFSSEAVCSELRNVFHGSEEFFTLREALIELRTKLGNTESLPAEAAFKPYLRQKIALAFGNRR